MHVIANGKVAGDPRLREAVRVVRERGHPVRVGVTWEAGDAGRFVRDAAASGVEGVIAAGGDGTINEVVAGLVDLARSRPIPPNAALPRLPALGIVPLGTANDFARGCGLPTDDLTAALLSAAEGVAVPIDVGRVNGHTFINVATGGFGTQVTVDTPPEVKRLLGRVAYLVSGVASIGRLQARTINVRAPTSSGKARRTCSPWAMAGRRAAAFKCANTRCLTTDSWT